MTQATPQLEHWPKAAASAAIFRGNEVLIVERAKGSAGTWSLPGGHIEPGETARDAAAREVFEETGLHVEIKALVDVHDAIFHTTEGNLRAHYLLTVYCGLWTAGEPIAASDARSARFIHPDQLSDYTLTPRLPEFIDRAQAMIRALTR